MSEALAFPDPGTGFTPSAAGNRPSMTGEVMRYLGCPRCGLSVPLRTQWLVADHCPQCAAHTCTLVDLVVSAEALGGGDASHGSRF
jgi:hypothetical protein